VWDRSNGSPSYVFVLDPLPGAILLLVKVILHFGVEWTEEVKVRVVVREGGRGRRKRVSVCVLLLFTHPSVTQKHFLRRLRQHPMHLEVRNDENE
jgi:hypothetical protein